MELDTKFFISKDRERFVEVDFKTFGEWYYRETRMIPSLKVSYWIPNFIEASLREGEKHKDIVEADFGTFENWPYKEEEEGKN